MVSGKIKAVAWGESADELYARYTAARDVEARKRLQALWLVRGGAGVQEAARQAGVGARTVVRWLGWYRAGGLGEVLRRRPGHGATGAAGRLSAEQRAALVARAGAGAFRTYEEARAWVGHEYGVAYTSKGMYSALARLAVRPKVPRPAAAQADPAAQAAWQKGGSPRR